MEANTSRMGSGPIMCRVISIEPNWSPSGFSASLTPSLINTTLAPRGKSYIRACLADGGQAGAEGYFAGNEVADVEPSDVVTHDHDDVRFFRASRLRVRGSTCTAGRQKT